MGKRLTGDFNDCVDFADFCRTAKQYFGADVIDKVIVPNRPNLSQYIMDKRTVFADLITANRELAFQKEKVKRSQDLIIANEKLAFQNKEKKCRAAELIIANKELAFQNAEKEKRAEELVIANKELAFQNAEKENRAAELIIANKELVFQNGEKENRAAELIIANKELVFQNKEKKKRAAEKRITDVELAAQYEKLLKIAFLQSHQVRVPVANILGLFNLFEFDNPSDPINGKVLMMLKLVAESLDKIIQEIVANTTEISKVIK